MQRSRAYLLFKNSSTVTLRVIFGNFTALKLSQILSEIVPFFPSSQHLVRSRKSLIDLTEVGRGLSVSEGGKWNFGKADFLHFKRVYFDIQHGIDVQLCKVTLKGKRRPVAELKKMDMKGHGPLLSSYIHQTTSICPLLNFKHGHILQNGLSSTTSCRKPNASQFNASQFNASQLLRCRMLLDDFPVYFRCTKGDGFHLWAN